MLSYFLPIYHHSVKSPRPNINRHRLESRGAEAGVPRFLWPHTMNWTHGSLQEMK